MLTNILKAIFGSKSARDAKRMAPLVKRINELEVSYQSLTEEQLKAKYGGKLYRVGITVPVDDESEKEFSYYFKRPTVPSYDRYIKTAAQGITKASKAFMLDAVIDEDAERLTKDMEENPGIAISIGNKLTEILGLTGTANLKKL